MKSDILSLLLWPLCILSIFFLFGGPASSAVDEISSCPENLHSPIQNFCEVTSEVLWRGAKPNETGVAWLIEHGVGTIVNLELLHDDRSTVEQVTISDSGTQAVDYYRIRDWEPNVVMNQGLLDDHIAHFLAIIDQAPKPVYVHCRSGQNRTGVMVAAYRIFREGKGLDADVIDKAIEEMGGYHGIWFNQDADYLRGLTPERGRLIRRKIDDWKTHLTRDFHFISTFGDGPNIYSKTG
ncbi:MAG: dual specificity protein phosphatase family protein [Proteobacteria bacterium]|nr:dual specificity protein phosphatase family protein [Pseudomonadota bacterium]MBU1687846.1 dual specificity protein phosphatase family protein [Pseudomonadota bacterium]